MVVMNIGFHIRDFFFDKLRNWNCLQEDCTKKLLIFTNIMLIINGIKVKVKLSPCFLFN
jgi:hypothetical protein